MSQLFTATDVTATNGNKFIQVNTGDDVSLISPNSWIQIGNGRIQEVKTVNTSATPQTIELFDNWNGASGSGQSAISAPTAAEIKAAAEEIRQLRVTYEGIAGDVNVSAAANSIAKRDSNGRLKATAPVASDDVVNRGYLGTAATRDVGTSSGNLMEVGAFGLGNSDTLDLPPNNNLDVVRTTGIYRVQDDTVGIINTTSADVGAVMHYVRLGGEGTQRHFQEYMTGEGDKRYFRSMLGNGGWSEWFNYYHSGNTNFNEFVISSGAVLKEGYGRTSNSVDVSLPLNSKSVPTGITTTGTFYIIDLTANNTIVSNVTPAFVSASTSKNLTIRFSGTFTMGRLYLIVATGGSSATITVNF